MLVKPPHEPPFASPTVAHPNDAGATVSAYLAALVEEVETVSEGDLVRPRAEGEPHERLVSRGAGLGERHPCVASR